MTTLRELGEYLIEVADNGRVLQLNLSGGWGDNMSSELMSPNLSFDLSCEYRLKPKVTYYRLYRDKLEPIRSKSFVVLESTKPFEPWTYGEEYKFLKDFEISE